LPVSSDIEQLIALDADLMVVVAYGLILSQRILDIPKKGCINIHGSDALKVTNNQQIIYPASDPFRAEYTQPTNHLPLNLQCQHCKCY
jgi:hypothetical protein